MKLAVAATALALLLAAAAVAPPAGAQEPPRRAELQRTPLDGVPGMEVVTSLVEIRPGESLARHIHHGLETAYVLQGAKIQPAGQAPRLLETGSAATHLRGVAHGGFEVVGDGVLRLLTVHVVDVGKPLYDVPR